MPAGWQAGKSIALLDFFGTSNHVVDTGEDSVRVYFLCQGCREKVGIIGQGKVYRDEKVYVV